MHSHADIKKRKREAAADSMATRLALRRWARVTRLAKDAMLKLKRVAKWMTAALLMRMMVAWSVLARCSDANFSNPGRESV